MPAYLSEDFLLHSPTARALYHEVAKHEPICDYHTHLPPDQIADNHTFRNLYDIWLAGDHYKWRAMRANGIPESHCTGGAPEYEKFLAWARTVPRTLRNPLHHWTHLELRRYFGIDTLLDESTAPAIWERANEQLPSLSTHTILTRNRVAMVGTTDDPCDSLEHHRRIRASQLATRVLPTFRPDKALAADDPATFNAWLDRLSAASGIACDSLPRLLEALENRHAYFHEAGCRLSDHGLIHCHSAECGDAEAAAVFDAARAGRVPAPGEVDRYRAYIMRFVGRLNADRGWVMQLHLGPFRNPNTRARLALGPDTGFDTIGDTPQGQALAQFLDSLDRDARLPRTILYNINPRDNHLVAALAGSFQDGSVPAKVQYGSGWWFLDQKDGIEAQLNTLSVLGLLSRFVGMLTDSRSFLSYPRHEYFRRILCNLIGTEADRGELPNDRALLDGLVRGVCFRNAAEWFPFDLGAA
jgi:glucuronate isomerase